MTHDEAARGIYIDFECLLTKPRPTPKLLGVLDEDAFEQLILDTQLAPARVANGRCRVEDAGRAIVALVARAEREGRTLVGWSPSPRARPSRWVRSMVSWPCKHVCDPRMNGVAGRERVTRKKEERS